MGNFFLMFLLVANSSLLFSFEEEISTDFDLTPEELYLQKITSANKEPEVNYLNQVFQTQEIDFSNFTTEENLAFAEIIKERGEYIAQLAIKAKQLINKMQSDQTSQLGPYKSKITSTMLNSFYCNYKMNYSIDQGFKNGEISGSSSFPAIYTVDNKDKELFRGYILGGSGIKEDDTYSPLYGVDCSSFTYGIYNLAGFCMPFYSSHLFENESEEPWNKYFEEVTLANAQNGDIAWFPGHVGVVTNVATKEYIWNGTAMNYENYNGKQAKLFRWKTTFSRMCDFDQSCESSCPISANAKKIRGQPYTFRLTNFCQK